MFVVLIEVDDDLKDFLETMLLPVSPDKDTGEEDVEAPPPPPSAFLPDSAPSFAPYLCFLNASSSERVWLKVGRGTSFSFQEVCAFPVGKSSSASDRVRVRPLLGGRDVTTFPDQDGDCRCCG